MNFLKTILILISLLQAVSVFGAPEPTPEEGQGTEIEAIEEVTPSLMGFQEWKSRRVLEAKQKLVAFKTPEEVSDKNNAEEKVDSQKDQDVENPVDSSERASAKLESEQIGGLNQKAEKLRQLEFNLEIAQGLTIHDYFALYLKDKTRPEMESAIQKLTASELSELLMAYRTSLYGQPFEKKTGANLK